MSAEKFGSSMSTEKGNSNDDVGLSNELSSMNIDTSNIRSSGSSNKKKNKKNTCLCCLKEVERSQGCSRCGAARYCGRECQLKHWPVHKNSCQNSNSDDIDEKVSC